MSFFKHDFKVTVAWPDVSQDSKAPAKTYSRDHTITADQNLSISASAAKQFHGNKDRFNPELLFIASVAECHMLTLLFLAQQSGLKIISYTDEASGTLTLDADGVGGSITKINLNITVTLANAQSQQTQTALLRELNARVGDHCFIRRSIKTEVSDRLNILFSGG